ncbi:MAG TPA: hypothetical protein VGB04_11710 [Allosphingosinicella sp.]|jgi:biopolymer transport protein ExbD
MNPEYWGRLGSPAAQSARAQLILALLLLSIFPIFWLSVPIQTHAVRIDLPALPETIVPTPASRPQAYVLTSLIRADPTLVPHRRIHELVITPGDEVLMDGSKVDIAGLWQRLSIIEYREGEWVDLKPDPYARYELFAEVLAMTRRARIERLRLDNRPFRQAMDDPPAISAAMVRPSTP